MKFFAYSKTIACISYPCFSFIAILCWLLPVPLKSQNLDLGTDYNRPNIVWIVCEDMSPHLSAFGEKTIQTPHLDSLAYDGLRFINMYTVAGVCAPSRSGIITGMYPSAIGTNNMRTLRIATGAPANTTPPAYSAVLPAYVKGFPEYLRAAGYYCTNNAKQDYQFQAPVTLWDESSKKAHWRNRPAGQPFFSVFNLEITHEAQIWQRSKEPLLVDPATVTVPPYYPDVPEVRIDIARNLTNIIKMDQQAGAIIQQLKDDGLYDKTIIFFYSDHGDGLPYVKREILKRGLHIPLIIKLPDQKGAGQIISDLYSSLDLPATVLSLAGVPVPSYMNGRAFMGTQKAQSARRYVFAARDRMDSEVDRVRAVMDTAFQYIRNYQTGKPNYQQIQYRLNMPMMQRMIQMRDSGLLKPEMKVWFRKTKPKEELYDLKKDPYQLHNLAGDARYAKNLASLRTVYDQWYQQTGDKSEVSEKQMVLGQMWNGQNQPPQTALPTVIKKENGLLIRCATTGASIGYKINATENEQKQSSGWQLYQNQPIILQPGDRITVKAQRIGFTPSVSTFQY